MFLLLGRKQQNIQQGLFYFSYTTHSLETQFPKASTPDQQYSPPQHQARLDCAAGVVSLRYRFKVHSLQMMT